MTTLEFERLKLPVQFEIGACWYTLLHIHMQLLFWAGNQGNHQNFEKSLLSYKPWLVFMRMKKKKLKKKNQRSFSSSANSQYFFMKISWIGPWVSRIGWCEGHWYMVVRLSDIRSKTAKKCLFCVYSPFLSSPDSLTAI